MDAVCVTVKEYWVKEEWLIEVRYVMRVKQHEWELLTLGAHATVSCHLCGVTMDVSYFHHYTLSHTPLSDPDQIIYSLSSATSDIFMHYK